MTVIDAHQHIWQLGANDCVWPTPDCGVIYRDVSPADFARVSESAGVSGSVLVQSQTSDRDTDYLLREADRHDAIVAVVGWVDLASPGASARIAELAAHPKCRGIRPMLQNIDELDWINRPELAAGLEALCEYGLCFDALVDSRHLPAIATLAECYPALNMVIDHGAKPQIGEGEWRTWREPMAALAEHSNVYCKLSGLLTEMAPGQSDEAAEPYGRELLRLFGPDKLMWGSDWPVLELAGDYRRWLEQARRLVRPAGERAMKAVFAGTARRFYLGV